MMSLKKWIAPTMSHLPRVIIPFLFPFAILFQTKKSFLKCILLFLGTTVCRGGKTVCGCLRTLGMKGETAFATYNNLLSSSRIDMLKGSKILINLLLPLTNGSLIFVVDEHLERRRGEKNKSKSYLPGSCSVIEKPPSKMLRA